MTVRPLTCIVAAWLGTVVPLAATADQPVQEAQAKFRSSIDLVSVTAVVRDRKGRFVRDLSVKDFAVAEAGEPRRILDFRADTDGPVRLALVYDVSGSMRVGNKVVDARQAARHLFGALRPTDEAALFEFDTRLQRVTPFTSNFSDIDAALDHIDPPYGQTSLYDAVAETARVISEENRQSAGGKLPARTAVVVLTDGVDTRSLLNPEQVSGIASAIDLPVYFLAVMSSVDDPRYATTPSQLENGLGTLARWTGGELFTASSPAHASIAARQIVDELRHQYVLAFEASSARSGWRPLEVHARGKDLIVRTRAGYAAGGPALEAGRS